MKLFLLLIGLLGAAIWIDWKSEGGLLNEDGRFRKAAEVGNAATSSNLTLLDRQNRSLDCRLIAKRENFALVERSGDAKQFLIHSNRLADKSRNSLLRHADFNQEAMDEWLFESARGAVRVDLLFLKGSDRYRCRGTGESLQTCSAQKIERFRTILDEMTLDYSLQTAETEPAGGDYVYLPLGIERLPCLKVGDEIVYRTDKEAVRKAVIEDYLLRHRGSWAL